MIKGGIVHHGQIFRNRWLPRRSQRHPHGGSRLSGGSFSGLVLRRMQAPRRRQRPRPRGHRQGHPPQQLYVRVRAGLRPCGLRRGRLPAPRDHHTLRVLCGADGGLRLRHHDLRQPQPLLRQRHQAHRPLRREDGRGHHLPHRGLSGRPAPCVRHRLAAAAAGAPGADRPHRGLVGRPQPLCGLSDLAGYVLLQGQEGGAGLRQRLRVDDRQKRV